MAIRVILVDDQPLMRETIITILSMVPDIQVVGEASGGEAGIALVRETQTDVVVMDVSMSGMNGIEATRLMRAEHPTVHVLGLSTFGTLMARQMLSAGACGYVLKIDAYGDLPDAIRAASVGVRYLSRDVAAAAADVS